MRVILIRHPPALIEPGVCYGRLDIPLHPSSAKDVKCFVSRIRDARPALAANVRPDQAEVSHGASFGDRTSSASAAFRGLTRIWTSPATRCQVVADAIARATTAELVIDDRLLELNFGEWEGRPWSLVDRSSLDRWADAPLSFAPPGGESGAALCARVTAFHADLSRRPHDCAVVSHGGPLKVLCALLENRPVDLLAPAPPLGSIRSVAWPP